MKMPVIMMPIRLVLVFLLVSLAGCATTGSTSGGKAPQLVQPPVAAIGAEISAQLGTVRAPADKALIYLYRPARYIGSANVYRISVNGMPVADMKAGTRLPYPVPPGQTTLQGRSLANILNLGLSLGLMEKPNVAFDAGQGKVYFIDVKTGFAGGPQFDFVSPDKGLEGVEGLKTADQPKQEE